MSDQPIGGSSANWGRLLLGAFVGFVAIILFWKLIGMRLTLSPWIVAVLPAAVAGAATAWGQRLWSVSLVALVLALATISSAMGEWSAVHGKLQRAGSTSKSDAADMARAMEAIARAEMTEGIKASEGAAPTPLKNEGRPHVDAMSSATIAWDRTKRDPRAALASLALSIVASLQATYLMIEQRRARSI